MNMLHRARRAVGSAEGSGPSASPVSPVPRIPRIPRIPLILLILPLTLGLLSGCGRLPLGRADKGAGYEEAYAPERKEAAPSGSTGADRMAENESSLRDSEGGAPAEPKTTMASVAGEEQEAPAEERKRVYSGFTRLRVDDVDQSKAEISALADGNDGYVESVHGNTVVIRVPADRFQSIFETIQGLGEVLHRSVETVDVTEYYRDLSSRLVIAEKTRSRLYRLLERTQDVEERLRILREIRRLTEEIERINLTLELLDRRIALSRITVELVPRLTEEAMSREEIPFPWIAGLNPLYPSMDPPKRGVRVSLGEEFAVFKRSGILPFQRPPLFRAESYDGTRLRIGSTDNSPKGDADFWQEALAHHLSPFYRTTQPLELGAVRAVLFQSKDREPFHYLVGVQTDRKHIHVVEVFFPDGAAYQARIDEVKAALREMEER